MLLINEYASTPIIGGCNMPFDFKGNFRGVLMKRTLRLGVAMLAITMTATVMATTASACQRCFATAVERTTGTAPTTEQIRMELAVLMMPGDVNGDGIVDIRDAQVILRFLNAQNRIRVPVNGSFKLSCMDVNGDGVVDIRDALEIMRFVRNQPSVICGNTEDDIQRWMSGPVVRHAYLRQMAERGFIAEVRISLVGDDRGWITFTSLSNGFHSFRWQSLDGATRIGGDGRPFISRDSVMGSLGFYLAYNSSDGVVVNRFCNGFGGMVGVAFNHDEMANEPDRIWIDPMALQEYGFLVEINDQEIVILSPGALTGIYGVG